MAFIGSLNMCLVDFIMQMNRTYKMDYVRIFIINQYCEKREIPDLHSHVMFQVGTWTQFELLQEKLLT